MSLPLAVILFCSLASRSVTIQGIMLWCLAMKARNRWKYSRPEEICLEPHMMQLVRSLAHHGDFHIMT